MAAFVSEKVPVTVINASGGHDSIRAALADLAAVARHSAGTMLLDVTSTIDGTFLSLQGDRGTISLAISGGRLLGHCQVGDEARTLDAEDALGLDDGVPHSIALSSDDSGMHVYVDGYETFSTTLPAWFSQIGLTSITIDPDDVMHVSRVVIWDAPLSPKAVVARSIPVKPFVEFAASALSERDAKRCGLLAEGAIRARFRTRGEGQGGVIVAAQGSTGTLALAVESGDLTYSVIQGETAIAEMRAPGHWDDGDWHDVVLVSGRGALDLYVDGFQVSHVAGTAFFSDLGAINSVVVGMNLHGSRLFGEAQTAMIYSAVLSDAQVKRLVGVDPLETVALFDTGYQGSRSYRIPSLLTLESGVVLAGADQRVSIANDSPNDINFVMRRSADGGTTWEDSRVLIEYPGSGRLGASVIDSVLVQDRDSGRVIVVIDHFPGGIGQPNCQPGTGFDDNGNQILVDRDGVSYVHIGDGTVVTADEGTPTGYRVGPRGDVTLDGTPRGNIYLAEGVDPDESLLTVRTSYVQIITSDDDGLNWSEPRDITGAVKEEWMRFFGTSPGNGIQLTSGPNAGRILIPVYYNHERGIAFSCAAIFSDDGGQTWRRGESPNDGRRLFDVEISSRNLTDDRGSLHESVLVEGHAGEVHVYMRNQHPSGRVAHAVSLDGGETWGEVDYVDQLTEIFSQPNAIRVTTPAGRPAVVFANASQMLPFRGCGVLRLSYDDGETWPHNRVLNPRHHVYQSIAQLPDHSLGVLWEREWQGLFLTKVPLSWLCDSRSTLS